MDERQLRWVHTNRRKQRPALLVGDLVDACLKSHQAGKSAWQRDVIAAIEKHVGSRLLQHAVVVDIRDGVLTLYVEEPALLYHLRMEYEQRLLTALHAAVPAAGVHSIRFTSTMPKPKPTKTRYRRRP